MIRKIQRVKGKKSVFSKEAILTPSVPKKESFDLLNSKSESQLVKH